MEMDNHDADLAGDPNDPDYLIAPADPEQEAKVRDDFLFEWFQKFH